MNAKKCDMCGRYFDNLTFVDADITQWRLVIKAYPLTENSVVGDLCFKCTKDVFINSKQNDV